MYIGVDIGGSNMTAGLFDSNKKLISTAKVKSKAKEDTQIVIDQLFKVIDKLKDDVSNDSKLLSIGIGVAGLVDTKTGLIKHSANINIVNINLKQVIEDKYKVPAFIENDVNVGIVGEWKYGAGIGYSDIVGVFVGTGIGGGLIINGQLYSGANGLGAEIGHTTIASNGAYCEGCGSQGCVEVYSAKVGIEKRIKALYKKGIKSTLISSVIENEGKLKSSFIKKALQTKDKIAIEIIEDAMKALGVGVANYLNILNPSLVIFGGGVMEAVGEKYIPTIKSACSKYALSPILENCEFKLATLGDNAGIFGAMDIASHIK